jgi:hypothetical protein
MTVCDLLQTGPQFLRADPDSTSKGTPQAFFSCWLNPASAEYLPEMLGGGSINPRRGTTDHNGRRAKSFQFGESLVYGPVHSAAPAGLELNRVIEPAPPGRLRQHVPVPRRLPRYPPVRLP